MEEITKGWKKLHADLKKNKKIDFELFSNTFSKTYSLLSQYSAENHVDKNYVALVATAFLFANTDIKELDCKYRAALALTERMITCCAFNNTLLTDGGTMVYVFEARKDIFISFSDFNDSIDKLEKLFQEEYVRNL